MHCSERRIFIEKNNLKIVKSNIDAIKQTADHILSVINSDTIDKTVGEIKTNEVIFSGFFKNNNTESKFSMKTAVEELLEMDSRDVTDLLSAIGNYDRYRIIRLLLDGKRTASEIVEKLNFKTTGKAYHHLNALVSSGLIFKYGEGEYYFQSKHIMGIMALLVGCSSYINKNRSEEYQINLDDLNKKNYKG